MSTNNTDYICVKLTMPDKCNCKSCIKERSQPKKPKVLLITGIHGNEERSQLIVKDFLDKYPDLESRDYTLTVYNFETGFNTRDVHFNLNRMDQVEKLNILAQNILSLKEHIQKSDIIIDIHKSIGFDIKNAHAHMTIARGLDAERMKKAFEQFRVTEINFEFICDSIYFRKFNQKTKQYSDIIETINFDK